jgi:hypothetical protein
MYILKNETVGPCYFQNRIICNVLSPNFHIHVYECVIRIALPILLQPNRQTIPWNIKITHEYMNVRIGNKATKFSILGIHKSDFRFSAEVS